MNVKMILFIILVSYAHITHSDTHFLNALSDEALITDMQPSNTLQEIKITDNAPVLNDAPEVLAKVVTDRLETLLNRQQSKPITIQEHVRLIEKNLIQKQRKKQKKKSTLFSLKNIPTNHTSYEPNKHILTQDIETSTQPVPIKKEYANDLISNKPTPIVSPLSLTKDKMRQNGFTLDSLANEFSHSITPP